MSWFRKLWARHELRIALITAPLAVAVGVAAAVHGVQHGYIGQPPAMTSTPAPREARYRHQRPA